jgi:hypothetical protein
MLSLGWQILQIYLNSSQVSLEEVRSDTGVKIFRCPMEVFLDGGDHILGVKTVWATTVKIQSVIFDAVQAYIEVTCSPCYLAQRVRGCFS